MSEKELLEQGGQSTAKKEKKAEKPSKPGFFARVGRFFSRIGRWLREMRVELKKVLWPTGKQTVNNTLIVIACVLIVGVFIWLFDFLASNLIQALIALFR